MTEPRTFEQACHLAAQEIAELVISKQHDYGQQNILAFGEFGVLVRMNDKFERLKNLTIKAKAPNNEAVDDSWKDVMGYALIGIMLRKKWFTLPMEGK